MAVGSRLQPLLDGLFAVDPEPITPPVNLQLAFNAAATVQQLHHGFGLPMSRANSPQLAARSLGSPP